MAKSPVASARRIRDLFRLARLLAEDRPTQGQFASKVLGIASVHLSYIEGGRRLPSEGLVLKLLAHEALEGEAPRFLEMLARERAVRDFLRDLERIHSGRAQVEGPGEKDGLYKAVTRAIAILSEGEPMDAAALGRRLRKDRGLRSRAPTEGEDPAMAVEHLIAVGLVSRRADGTLALKDTHYTPGSLDATLEYVRAGAEFFLDVASRASLTRASDAFLYDVFLDIEPSKLPAFQREVYERLRELAERYRAKRGPGTRFVKLLVASSTEE